jgi:hypothetical protein
MYFFLILICLHGVEDERSPPLTTITTNTTNSNGTPLQHQPVSKPPRRVETAAVAAIAAGSRDTSRARARVPFNINQPPSHLGVSKRRR